MKIMISNEIDKKLIFSPVLNKSRKRRRRNLSLCSKELAFNNLKTRRKLDYSGFLTTFDKIWKKKKE